MAATLGRADLHLHTLHSDGAPSVSALLDYVAAQTQLNVVAITDHDTLDGALEARELMCRRPYPFELIVGEEVSTRQGHLVGLFLHERIPPGRSAGDTVAAIHAQGGLAFAPHPFFRAVQRAGDAITMVGLGQAVQSLGLDAIEAINATPFLAAANRRAVAYNRDTLHLPELGNSDGHILAAIGKGYTLFPGRTAADLAAAIRNGQTAAGSEGYCAHELLRYLRFWIGQQRRPAALIRSARPAFAQRALEHGHNPVAARQAHSDR